MRMYAVRLAISFIVAQRCDIVLCYTRNRDIHPRSHLINLLCSFSRDFYGGNVLRYGNDALSRSGRLHLCSCTLTEKASSTFRHGQ